MALSEQEQIKQSRRILKKMATAEAYIDCDESKHRAGDQNCYRVCLPLKSSAQPVKQTRANSTLHAPKDEVAVKAYFTQQVFRKLLSLEWVVEQGGVFLISEIGKSALRRNLSGGSDFAGQHQTPQLENRMINGEKTAVKVSGSESPLAWLARRKDRSGQPMISPEAFQAGLRFERDFYFARLQPNITANWSPTSGAGGKSRKHGSKSGAESADHVLDAKDRIRKVTAFLGSEMSAVALDVCCFHQGLEQLEQSRQWPKRSGKVVLQLALHRLAEYYGMLTPRDDAGINYRPLSSWGAPGYRPTLTKP